MMSTLQTNTSNSSKARAFDEAIKLVGDFWTLHIIDAIRDEEIRFCGIERALPDINPSTLTNRLKRLEEAGVIERRVETCDRQSVTYALTQKGKDVLPVLASISEFTEKNP
jgi:DNA-binding HxlR family transcriptional regulator